MAGTNPATTTITVPGRHPWSKAQTVEVPATPAPAPTAIPGSKYLGPALAGAGSALRVSYGRWPLPTCTAWAGVTFGAWWAACGGHLDSGTTMGYLTTGVAPALTGAAASWLRRPKVQAVPEIAEAVAVWRTNIADAGILPGSRVHDDVMPLIINGQTVGVRLWVEGADARQHYGVIRQATPAIAAAYRTGDAGVDVVKVPGDNQAAIIDITYPEHLVQSLHDQDVRLHLDVPWEGPRTDVAAGTAEVGKDILSGSSVSWIYYLPREGARHGLIYGKTRHGKSNGVRVVIDSGLAFGGLIQFVLIDPQEGVSLAEFKDHAIGFATNVTDGTALLLQVVAEIKRRERILAGWNEAISERNRATGRNESLLSVIDPSPEFPVIIVVYDEGPQLAKVKAAMEAVGVIVMTGGKVGVSLIAVSQSTDGGTAFGGQGGPQIREQVSAGNVAGFASSSSTAALALDGYGSVKVPAGLTGVSTFRNALHPDTGLIRWAHHEHRGVDACATRGTYVLPALPGPVVLAEAETCRDAVAAVFERLPFGAVTDLEGLTVKLPNYGQSTIKRALSNLTEDGVIERTATRGKYRKARRAA